MKVLSKGLRFSFIQILTINQLAREHDLLFDLPSFIEILRGDQ